jgi:hypothetical protein
MWNTLPGSIVKLLLPSHLISAVILLGIILLLSRYKRLGRRLIVIGGVTLLVVGVLPIGNWMIYPLERRYSDWSPKAPPTAIIIIPGSNHADLDPSTQHGRLGERAAMIAIFARLYPQIPIYDFVSAGDNADSPRQADGESLEQLVEDFALPNKQVKISRGAEDLADIVKFCGDRLPHSSGERWLLVAPAIQMPLLMTKFRQQDLPVEAHPIDRRITKRRDLYPSISVPGGIASLDIAVYEWVRILFDRLRG